MFEIGANQPNQLNRFSWFLACFVLPHNFHPGNPLAKRSSWRFTTWPGNSDTIFGRSHTHRQQMSCSSIWSSSERCAAFWAQAIAKGLEETEETIWIQIQYNYLHHTLAFDVASLDTFRAKSCNILYTISQGDYKILHDITISNHSPEWHEWHRGCRYPVL